MILYDNIFKDRTVSLITHVYLYVCNRCKCASWFWIFGSLDPLFSLPFHVRRKRWFLYPPGQYPPGHLLASWWSPPERNSEKKPSLKIACGKKKCSFQLLIFRCYVSFREGCNDNQVEEWDSTLKSCTGFGFNLRIWYKSLIYIGMWIFRPGFQSPPGWHYIRLMVQKSHSQPPFGCMKIPVNNGDFNYQPPSTGEFAGFLPPTVA